MSWLWQDKKTNKLKVVLSSAFEEDKKNTSGKLNGVKNETKLFKKHVDAAFSKTRVTEGLKSRKHIIDGLEDNVTTLQEKISSVRQWNFNQLAALEEKEHQLF